MSHSRAIRELLDAPRVRLDTLQSSAFGGCPDELRGPVWKLLLGYLPLERSERAAHLAAFRGQYRDWLHEITAAAAPAAAGVEDALSTSACNVFGSPGARHLRASVEDVDVLLGAAGGEGGAVAAPLFDDEGTPRAHGGGGGGGKVDDAAGAGGGAAAPLDAAAATDAAAAGGSGGSAAAAPSLEGGAVTGAFGASAADGAATATPAPFPAPPSEDEELATSIRKDVERTFSELAFFAAPPDGSPNAHSRALGQILLVYAKTNAGVRYVQGMSELAAVFLYVCVTDRWAADGCRGDGTSGGGGAGAPCCLLEDAEADAFFLFASLMAEHRDVFIQANDHSSSGIRGQIDSLGRLLARREPAVAAHLARMRLLPEFYALRWLTTLCCRELTFPDTLLLWDSLLADPQRFTFHRQVCVAMVRLQRATLLAGDFACAMKLLQRYPPVDYVALLSAAMEVRAEENAERHSNAAASHARGGGGGGTPTAQDKTFAREASWTGGGSGGSARALAGLWSKATGARG